MSKVKGKGETKLNIRTHIEDIDDMIYGNEKTVSSDR